MTPRVAESQPDEHLASLKEFVDHYLRCRSEDGLVGEFLDDEGIRGAQYGLAGTCFVLHMAREQGIDYRITRLAAAQLSDALRKSAKNRNRTEEHLVKDVGRTAAKTATLLLISGREDQAASDRMLDHLLRQGISQNGLIKPVLDDAAGEGEPITTAHALHLIHMSGCNLDVPRLDIVNEIVARLRQDMLAKPYPIVTKLLISSALCMFDFNGSIEHHTRYLKRLFSEKESFRRALSSDAPFLDRWFEDPMGPQAQNRNRYVRLPRGYVVLVSIYVALGDKRAYFAFPLAKAMLAELEIPYSRFASAWKNRSAVYFVFFCICGTETGEVFSCGRKRRGLIAGNFGMHIASAS